MPHKLSEELHLLTQRLNNKQLTIKELAEHFPARMQALFIVFLCLPILCLIPLPGISMVIGIFILLNGLRVVTNKELWFPRFILKRRISIKILHKVLVISERVMRKIEKWVKPRGAFLHRHPGLKRWNGIMLASCGLLLALPLPPLTNVPPAFTAVLLSIGLLEEDGLWIGASYISFVVTLIFYILIPYIGLEEIFRIWPPYP
jgi:hypothetical protein